MNIQDLATKGYVAMDYPADIRDKVVAAASLAEQFFALPSEIKDAIPYTNMSAGIGYECKDGSGNKGDRKENFDVTLGGVSWLEQYVDQIDNKIVRDFITSAVELVQVVAPVITDFSDKAESYYGITGLGDKVRQSTDSIFIRFNYYPADRQIGEETGAAHLDQSGLTLHLFESHDGCQCLPVGENDWQPMPVSAGQTVIFPDMQLQLLSNNGLRALWHRVVATEKTIAEPRLSAVCFVRIADTLVYDKETHGRLQEKPIGFNYPGGQSGDLPEFKKLFVM